MIQEKSTYFFKTVSLYMCYIFEWFTIPQFSETCWKPSENAEIAHNSKSNLIRRAFFWKLMKNIPAQVRIQKCNDKVFKEYLAFSWITSHFQNVFSFFWWGWWYKSDSVFVFIRSKYFQYFTSHYKWIFCFLPFLFNINNKY